MHANISRNFVVQNGDAAAQALANKASATRDELVGAARAAYSSAVAIGGEQYDAVTQYVANTHDTAKNNAFEAWSESELKSYLDSYGIVRPFALSLPWLSREEGIVANGAPVRPTDLHCRLPPRGGPQAVHVLEVRDQHARRDLRSQAEREPMGHVGLGDGPGGEGLASRAAGR